MEQAAQEKENGIQVGSVWRHMGSGRAYRVLDFLLVQDSSEDRHLDLHVMVRYLALDAVDSDVSWGRAVNEFKERFCLDTSRSTG